MWFNISSCAIRDAKLEGRVDGVCGVELIKVIMEKGLGRRSGKKVRRAMSSNQESSSDLACSPSASGLQDNASGPLWHSAGM